MNKKSDHTLDSHEENEERPDIDDLMSPASWEARLAKARELRKQALLHRSNDNSPGSSENRKMKGLESNGQEDAGSQASATNSPPDKKPTGVNAVETTTNLNDRMAQAVEQREKVLALRDGSSRPPEHRVEPPSPDAFKKTILYALSDADSDKTEEEKPIKKEDPVPVIGAPARERSRGMRVATIVAALLFGLAVGFIVRDPLQSLTSGHLDTAQNDFDGPDVVPSDVPVEDTDIAAADGPAVSPGPLSEDGSLALIENSPVVVSENIPGFAARSIRMEDEKNGAAVPVSTWAGKSDFGSAAGWLPAAAPKPPTHDPLPFVSTKSFASSQISFGADATEDLQFAALSGDAIAATTPVSRLGSSPGLASEALGEVFPQRAFETPTVSAGPSSRSGPSALASASGVVVAPLPVPAERAAAFDATLNSQITAVPQIPAAMSSKLIAPKIEKQVPGLVSVTSDSDYRLNLTLPTFILMTGETVNLIEDRSSAIPVQLASVSPDFLPPSDTATDLSLDIPFARSFQTVVRSIQTGSFVAPQTDTRMIAIQRPPAHSQDLSGRPLSRPEVSTEAGQVAASEGDGAGQFANHTISLNAPSSLAEAKLSAFENALSEAGFLTSPTNRVGFTIRKSNVRFFHAEDAEVAEVLASVVDGIVRDFTDYSPAPKVGTIEIWLAGEAPRVQPTRPLGPAPSEDPALTALKARLLESLRRGDHL